MTEYTPSLEEVRDATSLFRSRFFDQDEFDRWHAAEIASAEQRGAVKALRDAAEHLGNHGPLTMSHREVYDHLKDRADLLEGDDE